jgi:hypothetical protein
MSYLVIKSEFLSEFKSTLANIGDIVRAFAGKRQILAYADLASILADIHFRFTNPRVTADNIDKKIHILYRIGFLGVRATRETQDRLNLMGAYAFYFNEGSAPLRGAGTAGLAKLSFVIHPIFVGYLALDTSAQEFIMHFDWDYLHTLEGLLFDTVDGFMWDED